MTDDAAACGERSRQAGLDMLAGNRYVDVHRVPQRLGLVEILHPDCRPMAEWVDRVVVCQLGVPEDGAPEPYVDPPGMGRDGERYLLRTGAIRDGSMPSCDRRDSSCKLDVLPLQLKDAARQPHSELAISDGDEHTRAFDARHPRHSVS